IEFAKRAMAMGSMFSFDTSVALHLQLDIERSALETRATRIASEIDLFREEISDVSVSITQVTGHLSELAAQAGQAAKETAAGSGSAASAASNSTSALKLSSQSIEELEVSIDEISSQAERSAQLANNAVKSAEHSGAAAKELTGSIANINTITKMISNIAGQTNPLALNATIEAARAGEAGRGFAVVAAEVKALVSQVEAATSDIEKILQRVTQSARASEQEIGAINGVVYSLSDSALSVSVAVQQQKSAVSEIRNHMSSIIANNRSIDEQFVKLVTNSEQSAEYSGGLNEVVADLRKRSQNLGKTFERFSQAIRAA
ncbi:MAG: hypothetical protein FJX29_05085, partial [Alphaproteobacteria bacterium]|nr:hypothetical protein [Alphaproteobacteria bacterium]